MKLVANSKGETCGISGGSAGGGSEFGGDRLVCKGIFRARMLCQPGLGKDAISCFPVPGNLKLHAIGKSSRRIQKASRQDLDQRGPGMSLNLLDDKTIDRILGDHPRPADQGCNYLVDKALLREMGLSVAQCGLAERSDFKLLAVSPRVRRRSQSPCPVTPVAPDLRSTVAEIVMDPDISGHGSLDRMTDVVDKKWIAIGPAVQIFNRIHITGEETSFQALTDARVGR